MTKPAHAADVAGQHRIAFSPPPATAKGPYGLAATCPLTCAGFN